MDSNCGADDSPETVGEKRPAENGDELGAPVAKKARSGGGLMGNVRRVAEIVMVLSAMGKMRGGRSPTTAETEMMAEAREMLAAVCEEFAPKNVFPREAFGAVMEDLGLNKLREQKLGFRPPKMSIAEKVLLTKQKVRFQMAFNSLLFSLCNSCIICDFISQSYCSYIIVANHEVRNSF